MRSFAFLLLFSVQLCEAQDTLDWNLMHPEWTYYYETEVGLIKKYDGPCEGPKCCGGTVNNPPVKRWEDGKLFRIEARIDYGLKERRPEIFQRSLEGGFIPIKAVHDSMYFPISTIRFLVQDTAAVLNAVERIGDSRFEFTATVRDFPLQGAYVIQCNFEAVVRKLDYELID